MEERGRGSGQESLSINWLVSVLIHFPEVYALNFNINQQKFKYSYMVGRELEEEEFEGLKKVLLESLYVYDEIVLKKRAPSSLVKNSFYGLTLVELTRETRAVSLEEIHIVNSVLKDFFDAELISEHPKKLNQFKEDLERHQELIKYLTINCSSSRQENIFAFRQEGKVFIFDK